MGEKENERRKNNVSNKPYDRFCQQAKTGEAVVVQGKVEHVKDTRNYHEHYRLIIGNKPSDFMALSDA